jgi:hypothetical protein
MSILGQGRGIVYGIEHQDQKSTRGSALQSCDCLRKTPSEGSNKLFDTLRHRKKRVAQPAAR